MFTTFINSLPGATAQGLIWGLFAIGVYITYKILDIADLTVDGSICTGACVMAALITQGVSVYIALIVAFLAGAVAGTLTGIFHTLLGIPAILSGILTQLMLWTVNLKILKGATLAINMRTYGDKLLLTSFDKTGAIVVSLIFCVAIIVLLYLFFYTELGFSIKSTGDNERMSKAQGVNVSFNKVLGLAISNGIVALAGALLAQYNGAAEINMGRGAIVIGLAAIVIGLSISLKIKPNFVVSLIGVIGGSVIYYLIYTLVITLGFSTDWLQLLSALVVAAFLAIPYVKKTYFGRRKIGKAKTEEESGVAVGEEVK